MRVAFMLLRLTVAFALAAGPAVARDMRTNAAGRVLSAQKLSGFAATSCQLTNGNGTAGPGTRFDNATGYGTGSSVFTNTTNTAYTSSAGGTTAGADIYVGIDYGVSSYPACKLVIYNADGTSGIYWSTGGGSETITITYYVKNGTCDGTGGASVGSTTVSNGSAVNKTISSSDTTTAYKCHWVNVNSATSFGSGYGVVSALQIWVYR